MSEGWKCPECKAVWAPSVDRCKNCIVTSIPRTSKPPCDIWHAPLGGQAEFDVSKCPCNPANGGSGICGCVLSGPRIIS